MTKIHKFKPFYGVLFIMIILLNFVSVCTPAPHHTPSKPSDSPSSPDESPCPGNGGSDNAPAPKTKPPKTKAPEGDDGDTEKAPPPKEGKGPDDSPQEEEPTPKGGKNPQGEEPTTPKGGKNPQEEEPTPKGGENPQEEPTTPKGGENPQEEEPTTPTTPKGGKGPEEEEPTTPKEGKSPSEEPTTGDEEPKGPGKSPGDEETPTPKTPKTSPGKTPDIPEGGSNGTVLAYVLFSKTPSTTAPNRPQVRGLVSFFQPLDGETRISGLVNVLFDQTDGNYTFTISDDTGIYYDLTGLINPLFIGGASSFSLTLGNVKLTGSNSAVGKNFTIGEHGETLASGPIEQEF